MAAIAGMSEAAAARTRACVMQSVHQAVCSLQTCPSGRAKAKGPACSRALHSSDPTSRPGLLAIAEQLEKHGEHVDEVEVEVQRAHDGRLTRQRGVVHHLEVAVLDPLRVVGGEA